MLNWKNGKLPYTYPIGCMEALYDKYVTDYGNEEMSSDYEIDSGEGDL